MRYADLSLTVAVVLLVVAMGAPVLVPAWRRAGTRRTVWIGGSCASALLVAQAALVDQVADAGGPTEADRVALDWFLAHRVGWATELGRILAVIGGPGAVGFLAMLGVLVLIRVHRRAPAVVVGITALGATALGTGFKGLYARSRPPEADQVIHYGTYALPSGHALGSTVVLGVLAAVVALSPGVTRRTGALVTAGAAVYVLAVGVSRVYLAAHWLTDVLVGWLLGGAWLAVAVTALVLLRGRPDRVDTSQEPEAKMAG